MGELAMGAVDLGPLLRVRRHLSFGSPPASPTDPGLRITLRLDGSEPIEPEDDQPMLLHEEEWMDLRAFAP